MFRNGLFYKVKAAKILEYQTRLKNPTLDGRFEFLRPWGISVMVLINF